MSSSLTVPSIFTKKEVLFMQTITYGFDPTEGACHGQDVNTFFPSGKTGRRKNGVNTSRLAMQEQVIAQFCSVCIVRAECLNLAFRYNDMEGLAVTGVWGSTEDERRRLRADGVSPEEALATLEAWRGEESRTAA